MKNFLLCSLFVTFGVIITNAQTPTDAPVFRKPKFPKS